MHANGSCLREETPKAGAAKERDRKGWRQSDDIAYCHLYRNGELLDDSGIPAQVTGSGDYRLEAYDAAGNMGYAEFTVEYHFNMGAILAIVLVILLIVAVAVFVRRVRSQIKVR